MRAASSASSSDCDELLLVATGVLYALDAPGGGDVPCRVLGCLGARVPRCQRARVQAVNQSLSTTTGSIVCARRTGSHEASTPIAKRISTGMMNAFSDGSN